MGLLVRVIVDNHSVCDDLGVEHGLSYWLEADGEVVLLDTGASDLVVGNAEVMGLDWSRVDHIVLSHGHYDHGGGLRAVLECVDLDKVTLWLHREAMAEARYSLHVGRAARDIGLSESTREAIGRLDERGRVRWVDEGAAITERLFISGEIARETSFEDVGGPFYLDREGSVADKLRDDLSLFYCGDQGIMVVTGCAHSGIVNILGAVTKKNPDFLVKSVLGGLHLVHADSERIDKTLKAFLSHSVESVYWSHCSGEKAGERFESVYGTGFRLVGAGDSIKFDI